MATPTFTLPTSGSDPRKATKEGLEENINQIIQYLDNARVVGDDAGTEGFYNAGPWDASTGVFPTVRGQGGSVQNGDTFRVSVAGTVDGVVFAVDQRIIAQVDNPSSTVYDNNWDRANTVAILQPITSRVDGMTVPYNTVSLFDTATLEDIKTAANTTTGTVFVTINDGSGRYSVDLEQASAFDYTTSGGVEVKVLTSEIGSTSSKSYARVSDTDSTESLNRAIQNSASGDIYLPEGTTTASYLLLDKSVRLIGQSRNKTTLNLTGFTTYDGVKAAIAAVGDDSEGLLSTMGLNGMTVDVQSSDPLVQGMLVMRKMYAQEVYIKNAPSNGVLLRSGDPNTQASYFSVFTNLWSKFNGGSGLRITDNSNANVFDTCQFDSNGLHGVHQIIIGTGAGINQVAYSNIINQGQASFNQYDGVNVQNGSNMQIRGMYGEFNSQVDGGNQKTGAGKLLRMGSTVTRCNMVFGEIGTDIDIQDAFVLNNVLNNFVSVGGQVLTPYNDIELGYSNNGTGRKIVFNGVGGCEHIIEFRESTSPTARIRYEGSPSNPANELLFEVTSDSGATWKKVIHINNNGHMAFFGSTPVDQQASLADVPTGGSATAADNAAAINLLKYKLEQLGLMET